MLAFWICFSASSNLSVASLGSELGEDVDVFEIDAEIEVNVVDGLVVGDTRDMSP